MSEKEPKNKAHTGDVWEDLVLSILSVNQYSLERTCHSVDGLRQQGLFDPETLMRRKPDEIVRRLKSGGYDRGQFMTNLFALRLAALGMFIAAKGVEACTKIVSGHDARAIEKLLLPVNGIGPRVLANFYLMRGIPQK
jgi:hypothetical protein